MSTEFTGLMDLATQDTTEVSAVRSRLPAQGIYLVSFTDRTLQEQESDDPTKANRISIRFTGIIDRFEPLKHDEVSDEQMEAMVGRAFNEFETLFLDDPAQAIGLLKHKYQQAMLPTDGPPGGVDGHEGWIDSIVNARVAVQVVHKKQASGDVRAYYNWLNPKAMKKAGIDWEELQREAVLPDGTPADEDQMMKVK